MAATPTSRQHGKDVRRSNAEKADELLGYLNFSGGTPDAVFQRGLNELWKCIESDRLARALCEQLVARLERLRRTSAAFADSTQASAVIRLVSEEALPAYRAHHRDLLSHLNDDDFEEPFFLARVFEAVLAQGPPWEETERIVRGSLNQLNDYVGYRPVAVLENGRQLEPYSHERFRAVPLYLRGAGVSYGRYHDVVAGALELFGRTPDKFLTSAHFDPELMDELALDVRAYDHIHPANRRANYIFGEWDPHHIDNSGRYRRFVLRKLIFDTLNDWTAASDRSDREERLFDASAVLCGTILMASAISGSGPGTYDSSVTLMSLLPHVARQRDAFYEQLLKRCRGARAKRLRREAELTKQPFGHIRQHLNMSLADYGARQVQVRHVAQLCAVIGDIEASQKWSLKLPSSAARFECEIQCKMATADRDLKRGRLAGVLDCLQSIEELLQRGIDCGAIVDPWNILAFQGQFPLFAAREDCVADPRVETLLAIVEQTFGLYARGMAEAAAQSSDRLVEQFTGRFEKLADRWDQYATTAIADLPQVDGHESFRSACQVAEVLARWRVAGEAAGDISFWRKHVDRFESIKAYTLVVDTLLERNDHVAAMGLLMQWLSCADHVGLGEEADSIHARLWHWMRMIAESRPESRGPDDPWKTIRRLFDYLEANAGPYWSPIRFSESAMKLMAEFDEPGFDELETDEDEDDIDDDDEAGLFEAAYDDVIYRESAQDGFEGELLDGGDFVRDTQFEAIVRELTPTIEFQQTLAMLWQTAAAILIEHENPSASRTASGSGVRWHEQVQVISSWCRHAGRLQEAMVQLMNAVWAIEIPEPTGSYESNVEYTMDLHAKNDLLSATIATHVSLQTAQRRLQCCLPEGSTENTGSRHEPLYVAVYRGVLKQDAHEVRRRLPALLDRLSQQRLLYVPLHNGGHPKQVLAARERIASIRFLLSQLPRLGLLRETFKLVEKACEMERVRRISQHSVSEFDSLFRTALKSSLTSVVQSSETWKLNDLPRRRSAWAAEPVFGQRPVRRSKSGRTMPAEWNRLPRRARQSPARGVRSISGRGQRSGRSTQARRNARLRFAAPAVPHTLSPSAPGRLHDAERRRNEMLLHVVAACVERYLPLWVDKSRAMRLSSVEALDDKALWKDVTGFVKKYGGELFHANMLSLGDLRAMLHLGPRQLIEQLDENRDPIESFPLLDDLDSGELDLRRVERILEVVYSALADKFDRFVEYNSTTTQSDYGEEITSLLDFLRLETAYERDAWNLLPVQLAHEVLAECGHSEASAAWEEAFRHRSGQMADEHLDKLRGLESKYGMRLASIRDHLSERFVKPLAVDRMRALIPRTIEDANRGRVTSSAFRELESEIDKYLQDTTGSGIDVPEWLRTLEEQVVRIIGQLDGAADPGDVPIDVALVPLTLRRIARQLEG